MIECPKCKGQELLLTCRGVCQYYREHSPKPKDVRRDGSIHVGYVVEAEDDWGPYGEVLVSAQCDQCDYEGSPKEFGFGDTVLSKGNYDHSGEVLPVGDGTKVVFTIPKQALELF